MGNKKSTLANKFPVEEMIAKQVEYEVKQTSLLSEINYLQGLLDEWDELLECDEICTSKYPPEPDKFLNALYEEMRGLEEQTRNSKTANEGYEQQLNILRLMAKDPQFTGTTNLQDLRQMVIKGEGTVDDLDRRSAELTVRIRQREQELALERDIYELKGRLNKIHSYELWQDYSRRVFAALRSECNGGSEGLELEGKITEAKKEALLRWVQTLTKDYVDVQNLSLSVLHGKPLCALIHAYEPERIDMNKVVLNTKKENIQLVLPILEDLGIGHAKVKQALQPPVSDSDVAALLMDIYQTYEDRNRVPFIDFTTPTNLI